MEGLIVLLVLGFLGILFVGGILGIVALAKTSQLDRGLGELRRRVAALEGELAALRASLKGILEKGVPPPAEAPAEEPEPTPTPPPEPAAPPPPEERAPAEVPQAPAPAPPAAPPVEERPLEKVAAAGQDWWAKVEDVVGKRWMTYAGGLAVFAAAGFFVKYAYDQEWITPAMVVIAGLIAGTAFVVAGDRFVRRGMRALGLGLIGAPGLPLLYVSLFAAYHPKVYHLIPQVPAFGAMVVVTVAGMSLAVLHNSVSVSFLALLGGVLTPVLVSTGHDARDALFGYLLILDLGVLGVAFFRKWRALDVLAFVGTAALFAGWYHEFYTPAAMVAALLWLGAFYVTFLVLPFAYHLRDGSPATLERFLMALAVAAGVFRYAWTILHAKHQHVLGFVALGMAACYVAMGSLARTRIQGDRRGVFGFISLAMVFLTVAVPLHLELEGITLVWAAEAVALLYLGYRHAYMPVRLGGLAVLALAAVRLFARHWPLHEKAFTVVLNPEFGVAAFVCAAAGGFAALHHRWREHGGRVDRVLKIATALAAGVLGTIVLHAEWTAWFVARAEQVGAPTAYPARCAGAVVWAVASLAFLAGGLRARCLAARVTGWVVLVVAAILATAVYEASIADARYYFLNARFLVAAGVVAAAFAQAWGLSRWRARCLSQERPLATILPLVASVGLLVVLTIEFADCLAHVSRVVSRSSGVVLWALGSAAMLGVGVRARSRAWRLTGLGVLAVGLCAALGLFSRGVADEFVLYLNLRFATCLLAVLVVFAFAYVLGRYREVCGEGEQPLAKALYGIGALLLLAVLSADAYLYSLKTATDPQHARWSSQMALSIVWSVYAVALLAVGFWRRVRVVRLVALGLFGVTAVKLVLVDLAVLQQLYRILSFLVIGVLMIGASYLYHRVEKHLEAQWGAKQ